ncbi:hypothetical protein CC80DRAFT_416728 [Byssothecium circinans]|uniref:Uncharacterized protein n=1 Tax=Byssothecium circinans TaxID=147558 RepID=A0A6A5TSW6_9PLEO|nr:hypothetical protein CC80DRAFT_416728 [Byssothecium circinans]
MVFGMLGWATLMYCPFEIKTEQEDETTDRTNETNAIENALPSPTAHDRSLMARPLVELLQSLGTSLPSRMEDIRGKHTTSDLHVSNLNASTLKNIGGVGFTWTASISRHLEFDQASTKLYVFCLPAYFELLDTSTDDCVESVFLDGYYEDYNKPDDFSARGLLDEVRLSYRLLFADTRDAQQIYRRKERAQARSVTHGVQDSFLDALCGLKVYSTLTYPVRITYNVESDFPIFGQRLAILQSHILSQNPNRITLLWRDRRDLLRWYTLWGLIFFGTVGIVIGLAQVALGAVQVSLAAQSLKQGGR